MTWSRESRQARGYGRAWELIRLQVLRRDFGLCQCDQCQGGKLRITPATEVNHRIPRAQGGTDDPSNLHAVAHECHQRITAEQQGHQHHPMQTIGIDGFPTEPR